MMKESRLVQCCLTFLACLTVQGYPTAQFHHSLDSDQLQQIFHVQSHDQVPEYDIVRVRSRVKRSSPGGPSIRTVHLRAFEKDHALTLQSNDQLLRGGKVPLFFSDQNQYGSVVITKASPLEEQLTNVIGLPYQDEETMSAVMISHHPDTGDLLLDGTIGEDLVVRPIPLDLHPIARKEKQNEKETNENELPPDDQIFMDDAEEEEFLFGDVSFLSPGELAVSSGFGGEMHQSGESNSTNDLPEGLELLRRRKRESLSNGLHIVYKRTPAEIASDYAYLDEVEEGDDETLKKIKSSETHSRKKRDAPYFIYPEILVLVDYDGYLLHGQDNTKVKSYYVSFWNGVDLRYKLLKGPRVKISIAGIIISRGRDAMPYLERNRVGRDAIDSASALTDMGKYLYQERRLPTYDIAVAITKLDMCRRSYVGGVCNKGTAGFAYVGGACVVNKRLQKVNSVAIVEDTGGFSGIIVAAHEVGHLLGAVHDGSPPPSYLGGPGARKCRWEDGYIMSDLRHTEKGFRWSHCSVEQFHHFLNGDTATCLYNLPHEDESLPRVLPGKLLSLDDQCRKDRGTSACFKDDRVCAQLFCFDSSSGYCVSYRPAAEGSDCGNGNICLNGRCTYDNGNSISDITIHRSDDPYIFQSTAVKPVYTNPPPPSTTTTEEPTISTRRTDWWNRWDNRKKKSTPYEKTTTETVTVETTTKKNIFSSIFETTTLPPITSTKRLLKKTLKDQQGLNDADCEDRIANIAGSLTCREFLKSYGFKYCNHRYIHKNCCRSQKGMCNGH